ncbi:MAG TPA: type II secretion system F family protein, partial [Verrucomicrobiae bacterium]|nr:type II secretion system F family protein [Verrucomicrobiae bacterium]
MALFEYRAIQLDGKISEGKLEAGGRQEAFRQIESRGLRPIVLREQKNGKANGKAVAANGKPTAKSPKPESATAGKESSQGSSLKLSLGGGTKISARILENFTRLLSSLLAAGVPLSRALVILQKEAASPVARTRWKELHDLVVDGMALADAMARFPDTFPRVYVAMVEAGETGGFLD